MLAGFSHGDSAAVKHWIACAVHHQEHSPPPELVIVGECVRDYSGLPETFQSSAPPRRLSQNRKRAFRLIS